MEVMMKKVILAVSFFILTGCSQHIGNFTALSSAVYDSKNIEEKNLVAKNISGESHCYIIILFPTCLMPKVDDAVAIALANGGGDFIKNSRVYYDWYYVPFIFGDFKMRVVGDVYKTQL